VPAGKTVLVILLLKRVMPKKQWALKQSMI
jgi:hypothetical protein